MKKEQDENTSEDNSVLHYGISGIHGSLTTKHHLDRVKTSDVTMAMGSFVYVCVKEDHSAMLQGCNIIRSQFWHN